MSEVDMTDPVAQRRKAEKVVRKYLAENLPGVSILVLAIVHHNNTNGWWDTTLRASTGHQDHRRMMFVVDGDPVGRLTLQVFNRTSITDESSIIPVAEFLERY
jgi:hypothetical protein